MKKSFCIFSIFVLCFAGTAIAQKAVTQQQTAKVEQEDASALNRRGVQYYLEKDYVQAIKCFRAAAEQGHAVAQYNLGTCYQEGKGVTQNYAEAVKWIRKAAENGHSSAQHNMGDSYYYGHGVSKDVAEAIKWYKKSAEQGHMSAQKALGDIYYYAKGVPQNDAEAVKWYRMAAERGDANAQNRLGDFYYFGDVVAQDYAEAEKWYRYSAEQGNEDAKKSLKFLEDLVKGKSTTKKKKEGGDKTNGLSKSDKSEDPQELRELGWRYYFEQDYVQAVKYFRAAAERGDAEAQYKLGTLLSR